MVSLAVALLVVSCCSSVRAATLNVSSTAGQTIRGFGASGAWWPNDLFSFPPDVQEKAANMLFDKASGLGLTSYRYNLGGGGVGVSNPTRAPETPFVSPEVYNFSADLQGSLFLRAASKAGVPQLTAFVNSAPPFFTTSNASCGGNINSDRINDYSKYIVDVLEYWKGQGVTFTHVSPMNEPDNSFGNGTGCDQEGMSVPVTLRARVIRSLRTALDASQVSSVGIIADETSTSPQFVLEAITWLPFSNSAISAIAHHLYDFADATSARLLGNTARQFGGGKDIWLTEICCFSANGPTDFLLFFQANYDPSIVSALQLGGLIFQAFSVTGDAHFDWWVALSKEIGCSPGSDANCNPTAIRSAGSNDGLIYYDPNFSSNGNHELYATKRFFAMKHFAQFVPIGSVRRDVASDTDNLRAMAFDLPDGQGTNILIMNVGADQQTVNVAGLAEDRKLTGGFITNADADWDAISPASPVSLPGLSFATLSYL